LTYIASSLFTLATQDIRVASLANSGLHDRLAHTRIDVLLLDTHVQHSQQVAGAIVDRLVGSEVPGVDDKGTPMIGLASQDGGDDGVGGAIRVDGRNLGANGAFALSGLDHGSHPVHVAILVHVLEDGAGVTD
jgi:hypothetical protein